MLYSFIIANVTNEILLASITKNGMLYSMTHNNDTFYLFFILFNNFIGAINYFKIISTISTGPKGKGANEAI
jgi:hypothetical protein